MISLFYQAWEKYRFAFAYERGERDRFSHHLLDLIGLGTEGLQNRQAVADDSLIYYAGLLAQHPRSAGAFAPDADGLFRRAGGDRAVRRRLVQLDPGNAVPASTRRQRSPSEQLGVGAVVGDEIWDQQSVVRMQLGPLTLAQYLDFLPDRHARMSRCSRCSTFSPGTRSISKCS